MSPRFGQPGVLRALERPTLRHDARGFTLIELLIVIVVLGVLSAVVIFALGGVTNKAAIAACQSDAKTVSTAVQAYYTQNGTYPTSTTQLTAAPTTYLQSWPASSYYTISLSSGGVVDVAAPPTATAMPSTSVGACSNAGSSSVTSTPTSSSTTSTTSTTTAPTTTTTIRSNGVILNLVAASQSVMWSGQDGIQINNSVPITSFTATITISPDSGNTTYKAEWYQTFPGNVSVSHSGLTYTYTQLSSGSPTPARTNGSIFAQYSGNGSSHSVTSDTWTITSTTSLGTTTQSGHF